MKRFVFFFLMLFCFSLFAKAQQLNDDTQISVLITAPGNESYSAFGHASIRVKEKSMDMDYVFNYGLFDFNAPNFLYRFVKGETDYMLGIQLFFDASMDAKLENRKMTEMVLNLTLEEKQVLFDSLIKNALPENRVYRYNFIYDNCATRIRDIIGKGVAKVDYSYAYKGKTFRELIHEFAPANTWIGFGEDLLIGADADKPVEGKYYSFLPEYLQKEIQSGTINREGKKEPLVSSTKIIVTATSQPKEESPFTPINVNWALLIILFLVTRSGMIHCKTMVVLDVILFSIAGLAGCLFLFMNLYSTHPLVSPNYIILFFHPLLLLLLPMLAVSSIRKYANYFHAVNLIWTGCIIFAWHFIPQTMNPAVWPLVGLLAIRSVHKLYLWWFSLHIKKLD